MFWVLSTAIVVGVLLYVLSILNKADDPLQVSDGWIAQHRVEEPS